MVKKSPEPKHLNNSFNVTYTSVLGYGEKIVKSPFSSHWPVIGRKKPTLSNPELALDLPGMGDMDVMTYRHIIGWGKTGHLAVIFDGSLHIRDENDNVVCGVGSNLSSCLRWDPSGKRIAVRKARNQIHVLNVQKHEFEMQFSCICVHCTVNVIEISQNGLIITGCSKGQIVITKSEYQVVNKKKINGKILDLKLSCKNKFLAAVTYTNVMIFAFSSLEEVMKLPCATNLSTSVDWHPWKDFILAKGEMNKQITVYNINTKTIIENTIVKPYFRNASILDCLSFCPLSAELLVSFYCEFKRKPGGLTILTVFKDLNTQLDEIEYQSGRVPHIIWNSTGTKAGVLDTGENLLIWNFFGPRKDETDDILKVKKQMMVPVASF
ncbi:hypothetical protein ABEB36_011407 [Hypothenemus hampei]|uniref:Uncharacterized protein n=1 Tax=Hypothenemus hampei TaxID=57062 RepID=A0ABD1EFM9_HYPHA